MPLPQYLAVSWENDLLCEKMAKEVVPPRVIAPTPRRTFATKLEEVLSSLDVTDFPTEDTGTIE